MYKLKNLGLQLSSEEVDKVLERVKEESTKRKSPISDEVLKEIVTNLKPLKVGNFNDKILLSEMQRPNGKRK
jgi:isopropylmalate/homocitrate/citramalate synthase